MIIWSDFSIFVTNLWRFFYIDFSIFGIFLTKNIANSSRSHWHLVNTVIFCDFCFWRADKKRDSGDFWHFFIIFYMFFYSVFEFLWFFENFYSSIYCPPFFRNVHCFWRADKKRDFCIFWHFFVIFYAFFVVTAIVDRRWFCLFS